MSILPLYISGTIGDYLPLWKVRGKKLTWYDGLNIATVRRFLGDRFNDIKLRRKLSNRFLDRIDHIAHKQAEARNLPYAQAMKFITARVKELRKKFVELPTTRVVP